MRHIFLIPAEALPQKAVFGRDIALEHYRQWLGKNCGNIYYDARGGLFPNAFAALCGGIADHHHLYLHLPEYYPEGDPDHRRLLDFGGDIRQCHHHFNHRLRRIISAPNSTKSTFQHDTAISFHHAQQCILGARGTGKSTLLAEKIIWLVQQNIAPILVVAPFLANINRILTLPQSVQRFLRFLPPDEACRLLPTAQHLIIDEAAACAPAQLLQLCHHYSNFTLATTTEGYEGSANTFHYHTLNALKLPPAAITYLHHHYRYHENDALDCVLRRCFLRDDYPVTNNLPPAPRHIIQYSPHDLAQSPQLAAIWQLLRQAHYRNRPEDLKRLLDLPQQMLFAAYQGEQLLGVLHILLETPLPQNLCAAVIAGQRRPRGRLLLQQLLIHTQNPQWNTRTIARIHRLAVHAVFRRRGIASQLLAFARARYPDYRFATSFNYQEGVAQFWQKNGFTERYRASHTRSRHFAPTSIYVADQT